MWIICVFAVKFTIFMIIWAKMLDLTFLAVFSPQLPVVAEFSESDPTTFTTTRLFYQCSLSTRLSDITSQKLTSTASGFDSIFMTT